MSCIKKSSFLRNKCFHFVCIILYKLGMLCVLRIVISYLALYIHYLSLHSHVVPCCLYPSHASCVFLRNLIHVISMHLADSHLHLASCIMHLPQEINTCD